MADMIMEFREFREKKDRRIPGRGCRRIRRFPALGAEGSNRKIVLMGLSMLLMCGCTTPPREGETQGPIHQLAQRVEQFPQNVAGTEGINQAGQAARDQINKVDIERFNSVLTELEAVLQSLRRQVDEVPMDHAGETLDRIQTAADRLSTALDTLNRQMDSIHTSEVNDTLNVIRQTSESLRKSGEALNQTMEDVRQKVESVQMQDLNAALAHLQRSASQLADATRPVSAATAALPVTIWLFNALLGLTIVWMVVRIVRAGKRTG